MKAESGRVLQENEAAEKLKFHLEMVFDADVRHLGLGLLHVHAKQPALADQAFLDDVVQFCSNRDSFDKVHFPTARRLQRMA
jgi:hypothetical protein